MSKDNKRAFNGSALSEDYKERSMRILPIARDFVRNKTPDEVLEYTVHMNPKDAYILGLIIANILSQGEIMENENYRYPEGGYN